MELFRRTDITREPIDPSEEFGGVSRLQVPTEWFTSAQADRQRRTADWQFTPMELRDFAFRLIELARARGVPLYVHTAYRSPEAHAALAPGVTQVTHSKSAHSIGWAVDIVHGRYHWDMTGDEWSYIGALGREALRQFNSSRAREHALDLTWGGNWSTLWDPAHWEITSYRSALGPREPGDPVRAWPRMAR